MRASVCRDIELNLLTYDWGTRSRVPVVAKEIPHTEIFDMSGYVQVCTKGKRLEALGRPSEGHVGHVRSPSSLLFQAARLSFQRHYPFALRPEVLMHAIVYQCAQAVKDRPDHYRDLFTTSDEKEMIRVIHNGLELGNPSSPWVEVMPLFESGLRERVPNGIMDRMLPDFSTHTAESRAASMVAFMDAASPYYGFGVATLCGIPLIRMLGDAADWRKLCVAAGGLSEVFSADLSNYFVQLLPILRTLAEQAEGASLDEAFWKSMYKYDSRSGGDVFNGWLATFVDTSGSLDWRVADVEDHRMGGMSVGRIPSLVSSVPFEWNYIGSVHRMRFLGGVPAVSNVDGYITPELSFAVVHDE